MLSVLSSVYSNPSHLFVEEAQSKLHYPFSWKTMPTGKLKLFRTSADRDLFSMSSREQLAVAKFAQCLQVIPKTLAINAALDAADLVSKVSRFANGNIFQLEFSFAHSIMNHK